MDSLLPGGVPPAGECCRRTEKVVHWTGWGHKIDVKDATVAKSSRTPRGSDQGIPWTCPKVGCHICPRVGLGTGRSTSLIPSAHSTALHTTRLPRDLSGALRPPPWGRGEGGRGQGLRGLVRVPLHPLQHFVGFRQGHMARGDACRGVLRQNVPRPSTFNENPTGKMGGKNGHLLEKTGRLWEKRFLASMGHRPSSCVYRPFNFRHCSSWTGCLAGPGAERRSLWSAVGE